MSFHGIDVLITTVAIKSAALQVELEGATAADIKDWFMSFLNANISRLKKLSDYQRVGDCTVAVICHYAIFRRVIIIAPSIEYQRTGLRSGRGRQTVSVVLKECARLVRAKLNFHSALTSQAFLFNPLVH